MARIPMTSGFTLIPEGTYVFRIYDVSYDEEFGKIEIKLVNAAGMTQTERFTIKDKNDEPNEKALNAFSYFAKTAMGDYILLAQNRFEYYDEQEMTDPMLVPVGVRHMGTDMFNTVNADIFTEFNKATQVVVTTALDFDCFADAQSVLNLENLEGVSIFAFVCPADVATLRKALKDTLQYVEAFAKTGYIGTVAGVNIYTKKDAVSGTIIMGTREAVTLFNKKGVEVETPPRDSSDANTRKNTIISRKYYLPALTDETKCVKIFKGTATLSTDTTASKDKTYYEKVGNGYIAVTPATGDSPKDKGWYTIA